MVGWAGGLEGEEGERVPGPREWKKGVFPFMTKDLRLILIDIETISE
jgi:hypothetical protein